MNQRTIKFRAWDKNRKKMIETIGELYIAKYPWLNLDNGYNRIVESIAFAVDLNHPSIVLMQFTGLKDKNGKEIYEGDIISYKNVRGDEIKQKIIWDERWLWLKMEDDSPVHFNFSRGFECEVIGNIYENKELLK